MDPNSGQIEAFQKRRGTYRRSLWLCVGLVAAGVASAVLNRTSLGFAIGGGLMALAVGLYYGLAAILLRCPACGVPQISVSVGGMTVGGTNQLSKSSGAQVWMDPQKCIYCSTTLR